MPYICTRCFYDGRPYFTKAGSKTTELILWLVLFIPGPFYTAYRFLARSNHCPNCQAPGMVRLNSDEGLIAQAKLDKELGDARPVSGSKPLDDDLRRF